jgi:hypothetical protein
MQIITANEVKKKIRIAELFLGNTMCFHLYESKRLLYIILNKTKNLNDNSCDALGCNI